jgi:phenylpropionate dioxygenase-like ring-hydroxylating dioxygenase large terminal subunit
MKSMLPGAPWLLAHKSMLGVNQPRKVSLYGNDYVMWKDEGGEIHCLPNACPHMGAMLSAGWCAIDGEGKSKIVCPFHALEFDGNGCTVLPGSGKQTLPQLAPLELIIRGDLIWSYGGMEPKIPIPDVIEEISTKYQFIGEAGDTSIATDLKSMLLNMHDYNHQNGTHRELFRITEVEFHKFIDNGLRSDAYYDMPTAEYTLLEKLKQPDVMLLPSKIEAHLENHFPSLIIFHGRSPLGTIAQCHFFIPEAEDRTRTFVLVYAIPTSPLFNIFRKTFLNFVRVVIAQDADILSKIYPDTPQKIKLNNEVGMDWVHRNFESFPEVVAPNLSR